MSSTKEDVNEVTLNCFELLGPVGEKLFAPCCVSVSSTGEYVVSDPESCFIIIYSSFGEYLSHFSTIPKSAFYLLLNLDKHKPHDVAWLSSKKIVYTQPWGSKVVVSNWNGKISTCIEGKPLYQPYGVCIDNLDHIYITDRDKGRILCYTSDGKLIKTYGGLGSVDGISIIHPHYIALSKSGNIVFSDLVKDILYIKIFNSKTGVHKTIPTNIEYNKSNSTNSLAVDSDDNIILADNLTQSLQILTCNVNEINVFFNEKYDLTNLKELCGISFNRDGNLVCIDQKDKTIKIFPWAKDNLYCNGHVKSTSNITDDSN